MINVNTTTYLSYKTKRNYIDVASKLINQGFVRIENLKKTGIIPKSTFYRNEYIKFEGEIIVKKIYVEVFENE